MGLSWFAWIFRGMPRDAMDNHHFQRHPYWYYKVYVRSVRTNLDFSDDHRRGLSELSDSK